MQYKTIRTGDRLSRLGFGAMRLPMRDGKIDYAVSEALIDEAYQNGVNYFDTAYMYLDHQSEAFLGYALAKYPRDSYFLADKLPSGGFCKETADIQKTVDTQLSRLKKDYIDYYLLHGINIEGWNEFSALNILKEMRRLKAEGVVRHLGFSFHGNPGDLQTILTQGEGAFEFVMLQLNYHDFTPGGAQTSYEVLDRAGLDCFVMEPLFGGTLAKLPAEIAALLAAANPAWSPAEWAFRFCLSLPNVGVILSGMNRMEDLRENLQIFDRCTPLSADQAAVIGTVRGALAKRIAVPCTACRYCMDCPSGVDIPGVFRVLNRGAKFDDRQAAKAHYAWIPEAHRGDRCTRCGACVPKCPQHIDIPEELAKAHAYLTE